MVGVSNIELNVTHFTQALPFYWLFRKISPSWIQNYIEIILKKVLFGEVLGETFILALRNQNMADWLYGHKHKNMASSKRACTHHHIRKFLRKSLVLKIHPNIGQTLGYTTEGKKEKYYYVWRDPNGPPFEYDLIFLCVWKNPILSDEHEIFLPKSEKEEITVTG